VNTMAFVHKCDNMYIAKKWALRSLAPISMRSVK